METASDRRGTNDASLGRFSLVAFKRPAWVVTISHYVKSTVFGAVTL